MIIMVNFYITALDPVSITKEIVHPSGGVANYRHSDIQKVPGTVFIRDQLDARSVN